MLRIAFITYEFPPETGKGGIGTYTYELINLLASKEVDLTVFSASLKRSDSLKTINCTINYVKCKESKDFTETVFDVFYKYHFLNPFDIIECPEINHNAIDIKQKLPNLSLIVRLHAGNHLVESLKKKYIPFTAKIRFVLGSLRRFKWNLGYWKQYNYLLDQEYKFTLMADGISVPSQTMKRWAKDNWKISDELIEVIPNPFTPSVDLLNLPIKEEIKSVTVMFLGRLNVLKGLVNLTLAMVKILGNYPDCKLIIVGQDGPSVDINLTMKEWIKSKLQKNDNQLFFKPDFDHEDLASYLSEADIILIPSLFESFSYVCAEAMAAGKAVIGSLNSGMVDIIENNKSGILIDPNNVNEIFNAVKKLIEDKNLRKEISTNARREILTKFNSKSLREQYINYYKSKI